MTALTRKVALKKVEFIAFIVQPSVCPVAVSLFHFLFLSGFRLVLNMHYMWFIEGQDLTTEAAEPSLIRDGKATIGDSCQLENYRIIPLSEGLQLNHQCPKSA